MRNRFISGILSLSVRSEPPNINQEEFKMTKLLKEAIQIQTERNAQAKKGNKAEVKIQEKMISNLFKEAKEQGIDAGELNQQLIEYTSKRF